MLEFIMVKLKSSKGEVGIGIIISIAIAIIIASFVLIPGLRTFSETVLNSMNEWWTNTIQSTIFPTA